MFSRLTQYRVVTDERTYISGDNNEAHIADECLYSERSKAVDYATD